MTDALPSPKRARAEDHTPEYGALVEVANEVLRQFESSELKILHAVKATLVRKSPFDSVEPELRRTLLAAAEKCGLEVDRAMGCMVGMAVADAVGHMWEFQPVVDQPFESDKGFNLEEFKCVNKSNAFGLKMGQWTDDCSMGLCVADSLLFRRSFDGSDMRLRFWHWWNCGMNNAFRKDPSRSGSVGLGGNISQSIYSIKSGIKYEPNVSPPPRYPETNADAGNGSLMRNAALPIFGLGNEEMAMEMAREQSYTTHPGPIAAEACALHTFLCIRAMKTELTDPKAFMDEVAALYLEKLATWQKTAPDAAHEWAYDVLTRLLKSEEPDSSTERCWNWRDSNLDIKRTLVNRGSRYNGYPVSSGYFGSYSMDGLALALHSFYHTASFDTCVVRCVNFLGDSDSHGAICAQLAGSFYGHGAIHPKFKGWIKEWDDDEIAMRAVLLHVVGKEVNKA
mmetsp:Transcript_11980/g.26497  ORF Transcript_11980/g.26497 Transcript_11980/m.26497 type:complete len:452 (+) Transcript_11980:20-1375(+)|eukprot:CAMPEP_0204258350 /NCGR_PEP_ID=MMETSP0468-20130131/4936_1 /ASSEMBLY_ACC=CAM_ASM_000383 /TAXON_ID=2969 /ORGANISM="Oxyrrhis marina" /LENGTH=451 /DNA_ID=CAMNT_0051232535 /DNA_START=18 /DNA_END=1373 /DNA_ORIENTATION=+